MPPRRRPRSWLAGRLRSAAGAVQRLAGRIEPDGQLPPLSQPRVATPRRFGEPPRHWLDLVAAHAPGLLHDLNLDPSPAEAGDGRPGESTGRVDTDVPGPGTFSRFPRPSRADGSGGRHGAADTGGPVSAAGTDGPVSAAGTGEPVSAVDAGGPVSAVDAGGPVSAAGTGRRGRGPRGDTGPTRPSAEHRSGRVRPSPGGDRPDGTGAGVVGRSGGGASPSLSHTTSPPTEPTGPDVWAGPTGPDVWAGPTGPDVWAGPTGPDRSAESTGPLRAAVPPAGPANQGTSTAVDATALDATALDSNGLPRSAPQPVRSMVFRQQSPPGSRPHRSEPEPARTIARRGVPWPGAVDHGPGRPAGSPAAPPTAERSSGGRDGYPGDPDGPPRPGTDRRGRRAGALRAARSARVDPATWSGRPAWPDLGGADAAGTGRTATDDRDAPTIRRGDVPRVGDGDRWPDLPGERARSGPPAALPGWDTVDGRATGIATPPVGSARGDDPWPALPDDSALWSVAGPALDTAQLTRLDREQAGD